MKWWSNDRQPWLYNWSDRLEDWLIDRPEGRLDILWDALYDLNVWLFYVFYPVWCAFRHHPGGVTDMDAEFQKKTYCRWCNAVVDLSRGTTRVPTGERLTSSWKRN